jgi:hypothetical protein
MQIWLALFVGTLSLTVLAHFQLRSVILSGGSLGMWSLCATVFVALWPLSRLVVFIIFVPFNNIRAIGSREPWHLAFSARYSISQAKFGSNYKTTKQPSQADGKEMK